jgi:hypothetical protein
VLNSLIKAGDFMRQYVSKGGHIDDNIPFEPEIEKHIRMFYGDKYIYELLKIRNNLIH